MVLAMVGMHRRPFIVAVTGAAIFATCTVLSSIAVQWVTDHVILPRFEEGEVETSTLVTGVLFIGAVGVGRAVGVVCGARLPGSPNSTSVRRWQAMSSIGSFASRSPGISAAPTVTSSGGPVWTPTRRSPSSRRSRTPPARC